MAFYSAFLFWAHRRFPCSGKKSHRRTPHTISWVSPKANGLHNALYLFTFKVQNLGDHSRCLFIAAFTPLQSLPLPPPLSSTSNTGHLFSTSKWCPRQIRTLPGSLRKYKVGNSLWGIRDAPVFAVASELPVEIPGAWGEAGHQCEGGEKGSRRTKRGSFWLLYIPFLPEQPCDSEVSGTLSEELIFWRSYTNSLSL